MFNDELKRNVRSSQTLAAIPYFMLTSDSLYISQASITGKWCFISWVDAETGAFHYKSWSVVLAACSLKDISVSNKSKSPHLFSAAASHKAERKSYYTVGIALSLCQLMGSLLFFAGYPVQLSQKCAFLFGVNQTDGLQR